MKSWQGGQSLPLMVMFVVVLSAAFIFLFNTGQLLATRMRLSAVSDHVAYSVATEEARLLNLNAYLNRASIANQLAVAQDVSLASWAAFTQPIPQRASVLLAPPMTPVGVVVEQGSVTLASAMKPIGESMEAFILQNQLANELIRLHQQEINLLYYRYLINQVPMSILDSARMRGDGVDVGLLSTTDILPMFLEDHKGRKRGRLVEVMSASREPFTRGRVRWNKNFGLMKCNQLLPNAPYFELVKRGGTDLLGMDAWKGMDTFSMHMYVGYWRLNDLAIPKWTCKHKEYPVGYGSALMAINKMDPDNQSGALFDGSWRANRQASRVSRTSRMTWDSRSGIKAKSPAVPEFFDIAQSKIKSNKREMAVTVSVFQRKDDIVITSGRSELMTGRTLSQYDGLPGGGVSARSRAMVYFERPYDKYLNNGKMEVANLFNPYWRVRLDRLTNADRQALVVSL
ncbi:MAG TPA: hypothetical protein VFW49_05380 [Fluviicoccus sp.]|nr:hypothetical protein [Fluviicoccus sp.]